MNLKYLTLALLLGGTVDAANPQINTQASDPDAAYADVIESGFAAPDSSVYNWVARQMGHASVGRGFSYQFHLATGDSVVSARDLIAQTEPDQTVIKNIPMPKYKPGVGSTASGNDSCYNFQLGAAQATARANWVWTYQYLDATNSDGTNDSNPGWELTSFTMTGINLVENGAINC